MWNFVLYVLQTNLPEYDITKRRTCWTENKELLILESVRTFFGFVLLNVTNDG